MRFARLLAEDQSGSVPVHCEGASSASFFDNKTNGKAAHQCQVSWSILCSHIFNNSLQHVLRGLWWLAACKLMTVNTSNEVSEQLASCIRVRVVCTLSK